MTRNWQDAHQKGQGFSPQAISQLTGIEVDLATALAAGGGGGGSILDAAGNSVPTLPSIVVDPSHLDRTGVSDCSSVLQAYINQVETNRGGQILIPYGKYYCATGLTASVQGTEIIGVGQVGVSDELATASTEIIVGDGQVGLTVGNTGSTTQFRGYRVSNIAFFEKNSGQAAGGLLISNAADSLFERVAAGRFLNAAGYGIFLQGINGVSAQYNTFIDCRVGRCGLYGFRNKSAIGTRWIAGQADGSQNGVLTPIAGSVAFFIESGDSFRAFGTLSAGYPVLWKFSGAGYGSIFGVRCEYWNDTAVHVTAGQKIYLSGTGDNSLIGSLGYGTVIDSGVTNVVDDMVYSNVNSLKRHVNGGTGTRYTKTSGSTSGASLVGNVIGKREVYDTSDNLIGYIPIYDAISGSAIQKVQLIHNDMSLTGVTSLTIAVSGAVTVGNTILIAVSCAHNTSITFSATDTQSNTYVVDEYADGHTKGTPVNAAILRAPVTTGLSTSDTITISVNTTVNYLGAQAYEYSGLLASPLDQVATAIGTSTSPSSGTATTTQAHELLFGAICFSNTAAFTPGSGYTTLLKQGQAGVISLVSEAQVVFSTGTYPADGTITSGDWTAALATYKGA